MAILRLNKEQLKEYLAHLKTIFQEVRILETDCLTYAMAAKDGKLGEHQQHCFKIWNRDHRCDNCISCKVMQERSLAHKFELMGDQVYIVFSKYVEVNGEPHVIEALSLVGDDMIKDGEVDRPFREAVSQTNHELYIDALTQAYNRRYYEEQTLGIDDLNAAAYIDIDSFKEINDKYGHATGDNVLREVAKLLKNHVRDNDRVIRMGGDEFIILFSHMQSGSLALRLMQIKKFAALLKVDGLPHKGVGLSIGGCTFSKFRHEVVEVADTQMYSVKHKPDQVAVVDLD